MGAVACMHPSKPGHTTFRARRADAGMRRCGAGDCEQIRTMMRPSMRMSLFS